MQKYITFSLKLGITALLVWLLFRNVDLATFWVELRKISFGYLLVSIAFMAIAWWLNTVRWRVLLEIFTISMPTYKLFIHNLVSIFYSFVLPGGKLTGDAVRAYQIAKTHDGDRMQKKQLVLITVLDRGIGLLGLLVLTSIYFIIGHSAGEVLGVAQIPLIIITIIATLLGLGLMFLSIFDIVLTPFLKIPIERVQRGIAFLLDVFRICRNAPWRLFESLWVTLFSALTTGASLYVISIGLGIAVDFWTLWFFIALSIILTMIPLTIAGIGLREGGLVFLLTQYGIANEQALAFSVLGLVVMFVLALGGGGYEVYYHFIKRN